MNKLNKSDLKPDKKTAAVCGLFCPSCTLYIGTLDDPARLTFLSEQFGKPVEDLRCTGCRTEQRSFYCRSMCTFVSCAAEKGVEFCGDCPDYPCENLKEFQSQAPHRAELWNSLDQISREGFEKWYMDMAELYACPDCGTINSAYDPSCRECGRAPANKFIELHAEKIREHMKKR